MADWIIKFAYSEAGVPVDVDTAKLRDAAAAFGVRRVSSGAVVVASGVDLARTGTGRYSYTVTGLTPGVQYQAYVEITKGAWTDRYERLFTADEQEDDLPTASYFTYDQFERRYGRRNIAMASNKENPGTNQNTVDYLAVQQSFDYATDEIHDALRGGVYAVPLVFSQNGGTPASFRDLAMTIAWENLYAAKGMDDKNRTGNKVTASRNAADRTLGLIKAGVRQIPAKTSSGVSLGISTVSRQNVLDDRISNPIVVRRVRLFSVGGYGIADHSIP